MNDELLMKALYKTRVNGVEQIFIDEDLVLEILSCNELLKRWCKLLPSDLANLVGSVLKDAIAKRQKELSSEVCSSREFPLTTVFDDAKK